MRTQLTKTASPPKVERGGWIFLTALLSVFIVLLLITLT